MPITKFRFTELPESSVDLKIQGAPIVLNQEYFISQQSTVTAEFFSRGNLIGIGKYQLGNDEGIWSNEALISFSADYNNIDLLTFNGEILEDVVLGQFVPIVITTNGVATYVEINWTEPDLEVKNNNSLIRPGSLLQLAGINLEVKTKTNKTSNILLTPSNEVQSYSDVPVSVIPKNNLRGLIESETNSFGSL